MANAVTKTAPAKGGVPAQFNQEQFKSLFQEVAGGRLTALEEKFEKAMSTPASKASPASVFTEFRDPRAGDPGWPEHKLKALSEAYSKMGNPDHRDAVVKLFAGGRGATRGIGWGPALAKMAGIGNPHALTYSQTYGPEQFEKEFAFKRWNVEKAALAENQGTTGGYTIPPQYMNELLTIAAEDSFIEPRAKILPMTGRSVQWPMLDITTAQSAGTSPYFGGILAQWQPEAQSINETEPAFRMSEWVAWDLVMYTVSSNQLLADNGIGLDALLTQLFAQAMTWYKEYAYLRGTGAGSSMPLGIVNSPGAYVQNRTTSTKFLLPDVAAMMAHLQMRSWDSACWVMHQSVLPQLIQMQDYTGSSNVGNHLVWLNTYGDKEKGPFAQKMPAAFFNGLPLYFTEKLPQLGTKGDVMLVDWGQYVIGQRLDFQLDVSPHYLFRSNQLAWRVVARGDGKLWLNAPVQDSSGWQVSPAVVLN